MHDKKNSFKNIHVFIGPCEIIINKVMFHIGLLKKIFKKKITIQLGP